MEDSGPAELVGSTPSSISDRYRLTIHTVGVGVVLFLALTSLIYLLWTGQWLRTIFPTIGLLLGLVLWRLLYTDRRALGFKIGVFGCTILVVVSVTIVNGVHGLSVSILGMLVLLAGWLVSPRTSLILAGLLIPWLFLLGFATDQGWPYPVLAESSPIYAALVHASTVGVAGALGYFGAKALVVVNDQDVGLQQFGGVNHGFSVSVVTGSRFFSASSKAASNASKKSLTLMGLVM